MVSSGMDWCRVRTWLSQNGAGESVSDQLENDVEMGQMVDHLVEAEAAPKRGFVQVIVSAQVFWPGFDSIHNKVHDKIQQGQPP